MSVKESDEKDTPHDVVDEAAPPPRVPAAVGDIEVNFCKRPTCANFGVPPSLKKYARRALAPASLPGTEYRVVGNGTTDRATPLLHCLLCNERPPIKSNQGIADELARISAYLIPPDGPSCPHQACANHGARAPDKQRYQRFGHNSQGNQRYRCRACGKAFSVSERSTSRQRVPYKNKQVLMLLVNKVPFKRICELTDITISTLYRKLEFIRGQCLAYAAAQERRLKDLVLPRLYLSSDRQDYVANWTQWQDQRNVVMHAVGTADNDSSYVFGMQLNFDPDLDAPKVNQDAKACGDYGLPQPYRAHARLWLMPDYVASVKASHKERERKRTKAAKGIPESALIGQIEDEYEASEERDDIEDSELKGSAEKLPGRGMQVHEQYTLYAHFSHLRRLLGNSVDKLRFFLDQDSGIRAACLSAFHREITARRADAFYVRIVKEITVKERRARITESRNAFKKMETLLSKNPKKTPEPWQVELVMTLLEMRRTRTLGKWKDRWVMHPFPDASEPEKAMCLLTDFQDDTEKRYSHKHMANLYRKASLRGIDRFFMLVRRRLSLLERPFGTAGRGGRTWYAYSPYQPENAAALLDIFRVFYNFCIKGKDKQTPAMRLGLATSVVPLEDILNFPTPYAQPARKARGAVLRGKKTSQDKPATSGK